MKTTIPLLLATCLLVIGCAGTSPERELITFRSAVFDTTYLQGRKGTPQLDDIILGNLEAEITLRGVFAAPPQYHANLCMLIEAKSYSAVAVPPHLIRSFDENIYSDVVLGLKDGSLCRVQHSYKEDDGLTIRIIRDGLIAYIRPNKQVEDIRR